MKLEQRITFRTIELNEPTIIASRIGDIAVPAARVVGITNNTTELQALGLKANERPNSFCYEATNRMAERLCYFFRTYFASLTAPPPAPTSTEFALFVGGLEPRTERNLIRPEAAFTNRYRAAPMPQGSFTMAGDVYGVFQQNELVTGMVSCGGASDMFTSLAVSSEGLVFVCPEEVRDAAAALNPHAQTDLGSPAIVPAVLPAA